MAKVWCPSGDEVVCEGCVHLHPHDRCEECGRPCGRGLTSESCCVVPVVGYEDGYRMYLDLGGK